MLKVCRTKKETALQKIVDYILLGFQGYQDLEKGMRDEVPCPEIILIY